MDSGLYIGNPANDFHPDVEWQQHGNASYLVFKNTNSLDDPSTNPKSTNNFTPAVLSVVVTGIDDDCWLTPCGNWKGPSSYPAVFADLKLSFLGKRPNDFQVFAEDYDHGIDNIRWLMQEIKKKNTSTSTSASTSSTSESTSMETKAFLTNSRSGIPNCLKFRHILFEVNKPFEITLHISNISIET